MALAPTDIPRPRVGRAPSIRATPSEVSDPRGRALGQVERDADFAAGIAAKLQEKRQAAEDDVFLDKYNLAFHARAAQIQAEALDSPDVADPKFHETLAERLSKAQAETFDEVSKAVGYSPSAASRKAVESEGVKLRDKAVVSAIYAHHDQRVSSLLSTADDNVASIARVAASTGDLDGGLARVDATANAMARMLAPDKLTKYKEGARATILSAVVEGHIARGEYDKAQAIVDKETGFAGPEANEVARSVIDAARFEGVDPAVALAIGQIESGLDPQAKPTLNYPNGKGLVEKGNIDLNNRPSVPNEAEAGPGGISTIRSKSFEIDGVEVLLPTVSDDGHLMSDDEAIAQYKETGRHLGKFKNATDATAYANVLHDDQAQRYGKRASSAAGIFQFTKGTGEGFDLPADASTAPVADQARAGAQLLAANTASLRRGIGAEPTPAQIYLAHVFGAGDALHLIGALRDNPEAKVADILTPEVIKANPHIKDMTVDGLMRWAGGKMQEGMNATAGMLDGRQGDDGAANIPVNSAVALSKRVASARKERNGQFKSILKDDIASIKATGQPLDIDQEKARGALSASDYEDWLADRQDAAAFHETTSDMATLPDAEIRARADSLTPRPGEIGFDRAEKLHKDVTDVADKIIKTRDEDPAKSVVELPEVQEAAKAFDPAKPAESWQALLKARQAAQSRVGIADDGQRLLTKEEARRFAAPIRNATEQDWFQKFDDMSGEFSRVFGDYADEALSQVVVEFVRGDDHAAYASRVIGQLLAQQAPLAVPEAAAADHAAETNRMDQVGKALGEPNYRAIQLEANRSLAADIVGGRHQSNAIPDQPAIQYLRDHPDTLQEFIAIYGEANVPQDMRNGRR